MSTQLNAQQGLTNLTPIKVIHILISLAIMVCFKFVPPAERKLHMVVVLCMCTSRGTSSRGVDSCQPFTI